MVWTVVSPGERSGKRETFTAIRMSVDGELGQRQETLGQSQPHNQIPGVLCHTLSLSSVAKHCNGVMEWFLAPDSCI